MVVDPASVSAGAAGQVVAAAIAGQPVSVPFQAAACPLESSANSAARRWISTSATAGAATQQRDYTWTPGQQWELIPTGDSYYFILNDLSRNMLDIAGSPWPTGRPSINGFQREPTIRNGR